MDRRNLVTELNRTLTGINNQIRQIQKDAEHLGIDPYVMRQTGGNYIMGDLLNTKAQILIAIASSKPEPDAGDHAPVEWHFTVNVPNGTPRRRSMAEINEERISERTTVFRRAAEQNCQRAEATSGPMEFFDKNVTVRLARSIRSWPMVTENDGGMHLTFIDNRTGDQHRWTLSRETCRELGYSLLYYWDKTQP